MGYRLKAKREKKGMTLEQLEKKTGLSAGYLCNLENNKRINPSMETMKKIAEALDSTVQELFFLKEEKDGQGYYKNWK